MPGKMDPETRLLPSPKHLERLSGSFRLQPGQSIRAAGSVPGAPEGAGRAAARRLAARLKERCGLSLRVTREAPNPVPGGGGAALSIRADVSGDGTDPRGADAPPPKAEGFRLGIGRDGIRLAAADAAGIRHGAEAIAQLTSRDGEIPALALRDFPALSRRAFMLDISRDRVPRLAAVRALIRLLARLRYNELLLYTEHTFRFAKHPRIGAGSGGFDADEIRSLDTFAASQGIELVPCLQTFGHMRRILKEAPYRALAETRQLWSVSPEAPGTYPLLGDLLEEYLPLFRSGWAHLNCDEPVDLGKGLARRRAEAEGPAALFAGHVNRVSAMARRLGKRPMIWADVLADHPEALDLLDDDIVLCDWWYEPDHDFDRVKRFRDVGREFLCTAGTSSWTSLFTRLDTALPNIRGHALAARRHGASGFILTDWGDGGHFNLFSGSLFPLAVGAEAAWGDPERPESELRRAFSEQVAGDPGGFSGELAARLGRLHDVGFPHFNHSPLKTVFFETGIAESSRNPTRKALASTLAGVRALEAEAADRGLPPDPIGREWGWALAASRLAAERGLAILDYREHLRAGTGDRTALAARMRRLADRQRTLAKRFRGVWLGDYRPEGIETALGLHEDAVRALREASAQLDAKRGTEPEGDSR